MLNIAEKRCNSRLVFVFNNWEVISSLEHNSDSGVLGENEH